MHVGAKMDAKRYADFMVVGLIVVNLVVVSQSGIQGL